MLNDFEVADFIDIFPNSLQLDWINMCTEKSVEVNLIQPAINLARVVDDSLSGRRKLRATEGQLR